LLKSSIGLAGPLPYQKGQAKISQLILLHNMESLSTAGN